MSVSYRPHIATLFISGPQKGQGIFMQVSQAVEDYRYAILSLSPKTQRWYKEKLGVFAAWCDTEQIQLERVRVADVRRFIDVLRRNPSSRTGKALSSYTLHGYAQVVKGFLNWCAKEDGLEELVSEKTARRVEMPRVDVKVIETFTQDHIRRMVEACSQEYSSTLVARDRAILAVLLDTGIRASELVGLVLDNVHLAPHDGYIKVYGKGRKERECGLGKQARTALHRYISRYRHAPKGEHHVFLSRFNEPLTVDGLGQMVKRLGEWGRVRGVRCSPHTCRHTYAVNYIASGGDVYTLSRLLGHASVQTTENYLRAFKAKDARGKGISILDEIGYC